MRILKWSLAVLLAVLGAGFAIGYTPDTDPVAMRAKYGSSASRYLTLAPGLTVHVRDQGLRNGPALVLVHGSNASLHTWEPWVTRLQDRYRIVTMDLPGHGLTGASPDGRYDYTAYAGIVDQVMQALGVSKAVIGGNSMGGGVAWTYALAHPAKVEGLILVDAAGAPGGVSRKPPIGFRIARMPILRETARIITPRSVFEASLKSSVYDPTFATPAMVDRYWELNRYPGNRAATISRFAEAHSRTSARADQMSAIKAPVLILWGETDTLIPVASAHWFHKALPGSRLIIYPRIGHIPMEESPDQTAQDVRRWLDEAVVRPQEASDSRAP
ncbi:MAG: hypothetical protein RIR59_1742 [Pseudomonadota bacterium]